MLESAPLRSDVPREQAAREIAALLSDGRLRDSFDIAVELGLGLDFVDEVCLEMRDAGMLTGIQKETANDDRS